MTQQALAQAAGVTQNAIFRIEAGETNPQLTTLQGLAKALGTTVREILCGVSETDPRVAGRFSCIQRIVESGDAAALCAIDNGIELAEALLERSGAGSHRGHPPTRLTVARRDNLANEGLSGFGPLILTRGGGVETVRKARQAFSDPSTTKETKNKNF